MSIIATVARAMQTALGPQLDALGRDTGVIRRRRKSSGMTPFRAIVLTLIKSPRAATPEFVAAAAQVGVRVTPEAAQKRFNDKLIPSLREGWRLVLRQAVRADPVARPADPAGGDGAAGRPADRAPGAAGGRGPPAAAGL